MNQIKSKKDLKGVKEDTFISIQAWMINNLKLKGNELMCFALIYGFSQDGITEYKGGISYIRSWLQCSKNTAISCLKELVSKGAIIRIEEEVNQVLFCRYKVVENVSKLIINDEPVEIEPPVQILNRGGANFEPGGGANFEPIGKISLGNIEGSIINNNQSEENFKSSPIQPEKEKEKKVPPKKEKELDANERQFYPMAEEYGELPQVYKEQSVEFVKIIQGKDISLPEVDLLWKVFKVQNITGERFYQNENQVYSYFLNWIKSQKFNLNKEKNATKQFKDNRSNSNSSGNSKIGREIIFDEL